MANLVAARTTATRAASVMTNASNMRMKHFIFPFVLCAAAVATPQAHANQALATAKNCISCHALDKKLVVKVMQGGVGV